MGNEGHVPACSDNTIINNMCMGGERNIAIGSNTFENGLVAYNTFVNASDTAGSESACVYLFGGTYSNAQFKNNIALQEDSVPVVHLGANGVSFEHNNWSRSPASGSQGVGDVTGDPILARTGPTDLGSLTPGWFAILENSPVHDRAKVLSGVNEDFHRAPRGNLPDMGAFEISYGTSSLMASATGSPTNAPLSADYVASRTSGRALLSVNLAGSASGGIPPYSYYWTFGDGSSSTSQYPSHSYASAGTYTVTLTVSDSDSANSSATKSITVRTLSKNMQINPDRKIAPQKKLIK